MKGDFKPWRRRLRKWWNRGYFSTLGFAGTGARDRPARLAGGGGGRMHQTASSRDEKRRREYLALLGIQPWYAKVAFDNARPSPLYPELAATAARERAAPPSPPLPAQPAPPAQSSRTTARVPQAKSKPAPTPAATTKPAPTSQPAAAAVRKPLHYLRVDDSLALLTDDGWEGADGAKCRDLLTNILKALGKTLDGDATAAPAWLNRESAAANAGRGDLLEALCERDRCPNLLIFAFNGSELFPDVSPPIADFARRIGGVPLRVTVTRGLREMLAFPDLKKYCWRDLRRLRDRLR